MSEYFAPVRDFRFVIEELVNVNAMASLPGYEEVNSELIEAIFEEAGRFANEVLSPLNVVGDQQGSVLKDGVVKTPDGFREAYRQFIDGGWNGLSSDVNYGGQGLPLAIGSAATEIWQAANMGFALCPLLTASAAKAINYHGDDLQRSKYLAKMISGEWSGTMNLTEPQAGSDLSAVATRAEPQADGTYKLFGQKIFITWGDHDCAENIIHTVLARLPDAPDGVKGISLFLVPKVLVNDDGTLGARNDVECVSLEHKLGIHASPTAVLAYGNNGGATGYLIGELNKGLVCMFTMMNDARLAVGVQGVAVAERAYQRSLAFAKDRIQGRPLGKKSGDRVSILHHPDVRRMLMTMKSQIEAMRALYLVTSQHLDVGKRDSDEDVRYVHQSRADLLVPVCKGWSTELGFEIAALGVQIHGGMGFVEETGAAQHLRDARITTIYEGTTGIQANDLVGRKIAGDGGDSMRELVQAIKEISAELCAAKHKDLNVIGESLSAASDDLVSAIDWMVQEIQNNPASAMAGSVTLLMLTGYVAGGWQMGRAALVAETRLQAGSDKEFHDAKLKTARFYAEHILPKSAALSRSCRAGGATMLDMTAEQF